MIAKSLSPRARGMFFIGKPYPNNADKGDWHQTRVLRWNSDTNGTYNAGRNKAKRLRKAA